MHLPALPTSPAANHASMPSDVNVGDATPPDGEEAAQLAAWQSGLALLAQEWPSLPGLLLAAAVTRLAGGGQPAPHALTWARLLLQHARAPNSPGRSFGDSAGGGAARSRAQPLRSAFSWQLGQAQPASLLVMCLAALRQPCTADATGVLEVALLLADAGGGACCPQDVTLEVSRKPHGRRPFPCWLGVRSKRSLTWSFGAGCNGCSNKVVQPGCPAAASVSHNVGPRQVPEQRFASLICERLKCSHPPRTGRGPLFTRQFCSCGWQQDLAAGATVGAVRDWWHAIAARSKWQLCPHVAASC